LDKRETSYWFHNIFILLNCSAIIEYFFNNQVQRFFLLKKVLLPLINNINIMKKTNLLFTALFACIIFVTSCKKEEEFIVSFSPNGGRGNMTSQMFKAGEPQALSPNAFQYEHYAFAGWNTSYNGEGKAFADKEMITVTAGMTLYAQWELTSNIYHVTFYANGGEGEMTPQPFYENELKELKANTFARAEYLFSNWNTRPDGSGITYSNKQGVRLNFDMTLYAQWVSIYGDAEPCPGMPTVTDIDGNTYHTVQIGAQCWMRQNLRTTKYNTGEAIPFVANLYEWIEMTTGAMCHYHNNAGYGVKYGALYNGYAAMDDNLCPEGWHIPSNQDWNTLANYLGGNNVAGHKMKTTYDWAGEGPGYNPNGSNESGFSALPAGRRREQVNYQGLGTIAVFWSYTERSYVMLSDADRLDYATTPHLIDGFSVRCVKD
jgi:uncharacterized protein (TIGR02145 family)